MGCPKTVDAVGSSVQAEDFASKTFGIGSSLPPGTLTPSSSCSAEKNSCPGRRVVLVNRERDPVSELSLNLI